LWFIGAFKFACFDICQVLLACLCHVCRISYKVLNFWAPDTQYHLWYHPYSNRCKNVRCRSTWPGTAVVLLLLMNKCNSWTANSRKNEYSSVCTGETHEVSWHILYSVEFLKCNGKTRLHWNGSNYCSMVKETTLVTTGCTWKRKQLRKPRYETRVSFASKANLILCSELSTPLRASP